MKKLTGILIKLFKTEPQSPSSNLDFQVGVFPNATIVSNQMHPQMSSEFITEVNDDIVMAEQGTSQLLVIRRLQLRGWILEPSYRWEEVEI